MLKGGECNRLAEGERAESAQVYLNEQQLKYPPQKF